MLYVEASKKRDNNGVRTFCDAINRWPAADSPPRHLQPTESEC